MFELKKRITIICGHYGSGKTNLALNLALNGARAGEKVTIVDLDIVNPYFRTSDYSKLLAENGIELICPSLAGTTVDAPALPSQMYSAFEQRSGRVIIDVGGDDAGATALGRFSGLVGSDYEMIYVINMYRKLISNAEEAFLLLQEIETAARLKATGLINNSHLSQQTEASDILYSQEYAIEVSRLSKLPVMATTAPAALAGELENKIKNLLPLSIHVGLPWQKN